MYSFFSVFAGIIGFVVFVSLIGVGIYYLFRSQIVWDFVQTALGEAFICAFDNSKGKEVPDIVLNPGEVVVRQYWAASLPWRSESSAFLTITNRRLIISGIGRNIFGAVTSQFSKQVRVTDVVGLGTDFTTQRVWLVFLIVLALLTILQVWVILWISLQFAIYEVSTEYVATLRATPLGESVPELVYPTILELGFSIWQWVLSGFLVFLSLYPALLLSIKRTFVIEVYAAISSAAVSLGEGYSPASAIRTQWGQPTPQTREIIQNVGAMIEDIKTNGDDAIERWRQDIEQAQEAEKEDEEKTETEGEE